MATQDLSAGLDLARKYSLTLAQFLTLYGFGYRTKGSLSGPLSKMSKGLRHRVLSYFSPRGVKPLAFNIWISMKTVTDRYAFTSRKADRIISSYLSEDIRSVLTTLSSEHFCALLDVVKSLITVKRDREFYGTTLRKNDRINRFDDLITYYNSLRVGYTKWVELSEDGTMIEHHNEFITESMLSKHTKVVKDVQYLLDSLIELVYRPTYSDVLINVRDIRNSCEELLESLGDGSLTTTQDKLSRLDEVFSKISELNTVLSSLPVPRELYKVVEKDLTRTESKLVRSWERYITVLRSTRS
jgi:hypothetical protein